MGTLIHSLLSILRAAFRSQATLALESLALRQQLATYQRTRRRPRLRPVSAPLPERPVAHGRSQDLADVLLSIRKSTTKSADSVFGTDSVRMGCPVPAITELSLWEVPVGSVRSPRMGFSRSTGGRAEPSPGTAVSDRAEVIWPQGSIALHFSSTSFLLTVAPSSVRN
jgi:hypothetical protein